MRLLPSALLAAQKSATAKPYVKVEVVEKLGAATRLTWDRLYDGGEPDCHHDATVPGDGSLVRIRGGGGIYRQRVVDPGPGSDFSQWHYWGFTGADVAVCARAAEALAFWVQSSGWLRRRESSTYGESWGDPIQMSYIGGDYASYRVAACFKPNGDALLLYSDGATLYRRRRIDGVWEAAAPWGNSLASIAGVAVTYCGDWNVVVAGADHTERAGVWTCVLGDGYSMPADSWSPLREVIVASAGSDIEFRAPSLDVPDVFRVFFVECYHGSETYSRPYWSHGFAGADFISNLWREPVPFNLCCEHGVALAHDPSPAEGDAWLCTAFGVWRAPLTPAWVDVSDDVIEVRTRIQPFSGRLHLSLRNDDGRFNNRSCGPYAPLKKGSSVRLHLGYHTVEGPLSSPAPAFWLDGWEYVSDGGSGLFVLHAGDGWSLLERWRARRQFAWQKDEQNIFQLLEFLFARAGLQFSSLSYSDAIFQYPAFTIHPGESGLTAVRRLLTMVPDVIMFGTDVAYLLDPRAGDASSYSYGGATGAAHAVLGGRLAQSVQAANRAQAFGRNVVTEDWDWPEIEQVYDRLVQAKDLNLDSTHTAHQRGQAILRGAAIEAANGSLLVPMNCGQELHDVIDITSTYLALEASRRRVLSLEHRWTPRRGLYTLGMGVGAP